MKKKSMLWVITPLFITLFAIVSAEEEELYDQQEVAEEAIVGQNEEKAPLKSPRKSEKKKEASVSQRKVAKRRNPSVQGMTSARTKLKEARQNSDRPRVTHRNPSRSESQIEADASEEDSLSEEFLEEKRIREEQTKAASES